MRAGLGWDVRTAEAVEVRRHWRAVTASPPVLVIGGKDPGLVMEENPRCPLVLWLFGADPSMSDLGYRPVFPVMLHRSLEYAAEWLPNRQLSVGDTLRIAHGLADEVKAPGGAAAAMVPGGRYDSWMLQEPGWYLIAGPSGRRLAAANLPTGESELEPLAQNRLSALFGGAVTGRDGVAAAARPAWKALLLMALLLLAAESAVRTSLAGQKNG
jgi:hypothetical protein